MNKNKAYVILVVLGILTLIFMIFFSYPLAVAVQSHIFDNRIHTVFKVIDGNISKCYLNEGIISNCEYYSKGVD